LIRTDGNCIDKREGMINQQGYICKYYKHKSIVIMFYYNIYFDYRKSYVNSFNYSVLVAKELSNKKRKRISIATKTKSKFTKLYPYNNIILNIYSLFQFFFWIQ